MNAKKTLAPDAIALVVLMALAGALMFWQLGRRYLWQDEAATAVLAERMLEYGRPLAYDGRNLITMDVMTDADQVGFTRRIRDPEVAVRYFAERGDYKDDTTWIGQPWGQFVLAGASLGTLGHGTWQARAPFALCGVLTVAALYCYVRGRFDDRLMAFLAALALLANVYWILHMRQCRYYAPSSLFLLLTVAAYVRWQDARRAGAAIFVATAWLWFQIDYGTFWPVVGVLAIDALVRRRRSRAVSVATFAVLGGCVTPWVVYYELTSRLKATPYDFDARLLGLVFSLNQFLIPLVLLALVIWFVWRDRRSLSPDRHQLLGVSIGAIGVQFLWVPLVAPAPYHRYIVALTPLASLLVAYAIVRTVSLVAGGPVSGLRRGLVATVFMLLIVLLPSLSDVVAYLIPRYYWRAVSTGDWLRYEWRVLAADLGGAYGDPNGELVEFLRRRLRPDDEILITYEDIPLMFYLPHRIRGGVTCFRMGDPHGSPPRFLVDRSVIPYDDFQNEALEAYVASRKWRSLRHDIPDFRAGNCPDPALHFTNTAGHGQLIVILERDDEIPAP